MDQSLITATQQNWAGAVSAGLRNGIYSFREAAQLLSVSSQRVRRWADGYTFACKSGESKSGPILQTNRDTPVLSFPELIELMFVREYVSLGVSLQHIRATSEALAREVGPYPFNSQQLLVNGKELIIRTAEEAFKRPDVGQLIFDYAENSLVRSLDFSNEMVCRYNIPEYEKTIYLDRSLRGGEPAVSEFAIPTRIIFDLWEREESVDPVADYFALPEHLVMAAIRYEGQWRIAA